MISNTADPTILHSSNEEYEISKLLGSGYYGQAYKCQTRHTGKSVALKIQKRGLQAIGFMYDSEVQFLQRLQNEDQEKYNFLKVLDCFEYQNQKCIVTELLSETLYDYVCSRRTLSAENICNVASQLLVSLLKLKEIGIVHADLNLKNVMFVDNPNDSLRVKIIDYGNAIWNSQVRHSPRGPEKLSNLKLTTSTDMWQLGCIMAVLLMQSSKSMTKSSKYRELKDILELQTFTNPTSSDSFNKSLNILKLLKFKKDLEEQENLKESYNRQRLTDLLIRMLVYNPEHRITPEKALLHEAVKRFVPQEV